MENPSTTLPGMRFVRFIKPYCNPYVQAHTLLNDFELAGQYVLIAAWEDPIAAARLHHSLHAIIVRERKRLRNPLHHPLGILTLSEKYLFMRESYLCRCERSQRLRITHVLPASEPKRQVHQLLRSGMASDCWIVVRCVDDRDEYAALQLGFISHLDEYMSGNQQQSFCGTCAPPRGVIMYTSKVLCCMRTYQSTHTHPQSEDRL